MWNHSWGTPSVVVVRIDGETIHTARQTCEACGTVRNPLNNVITYFPRARGCRQMVEQGKVRDWDKEIRQIEWVLDAHESDGHRVDRYHTGRKKKPSASSLELPLPYKD